MAAERVALMRTLIASAGGAGSGAGWSALWQRDLFLWDLGCPTAAAIDEFSKASSDGRLPKSNARVFIPGCGSAYDVAALAKTSFAPNVLGLDIAPEAVQRARTQLVDTPSASVVCGDFFTQEMEPVDFIFDYTFFCALPPPLRSSWGERTASLIKPGGRLLTLAFPIAPEELALDPAANGPPFPVCERAYRDALETHGLILESGPYRNDKSQRENELVMWWKKKSEAVSEEAKVEEKEEEEEEEEEESEADFKTKLYELLFFWYGTNHPLKEMTDGAIEQVWQSVWFAKGARMQEVDKFFGQYGPLLGHLAAQAEAQEVAEEGSRCSSSSSSNGLSSTTTKEDAENMAKLLVFDQISRNIHRGTPLAYSFDKFALPLAKRYYNDETKFRSLPRHFQFSIIIAVCHSEVREDQQIVRDFAESMPHTCLGLSFRGIATNHMDRVKLFGRFPERNEFFGRASTEEEKTYLQVLYSNKG